MGETSRRSLARRLGAVRGWLVCVFRPDRRTTKVGEARVPSERIRYARSADGVRIAWAESGAGPRTLVIAANHITNIARDWESPDRVGPLRRLGDQFRIIRYDHRGCGSSQRNIERQGQQAWAEDLAAVVEAADAREPVVLLAFSQAGPCAAQYAAQHGERLSHLVLYGVYPHGSSAGGLPDEIARRDAMVELVRVDWGAPTRGARLLVTHQLIVDPTPDEQNWFDSIWPLAATTEDAVRFLRADASCDARPYLANIRTPTLVAHPAWDTCVLPAWGREVAARIPGAEFVELPGRNHILLERDPAFEPFMRHIREFTRAGAPDRPFSALSTRERDILDGVCAGLSNEAIALQRGISPKTVRNHLTSVFDKLGVNSRTQAAIKFSTSQAMLSSSPPRDVA
jgi:pimeloyl-ACP methyl ester carboxylesterase